MLEIQSAKDATQGIVTRSTVFKNQVLLQEIDTFFGEGFDFIPTLATGSDPAKGGEQNFGQGLQSSTFDTRVVKIIEVVEKRPKFVSQYHGVHL